MFKDIKPQSGESTMTQNQKYFGMTTTQIAILAGLAGMVCLLFAVAGLLVLRGGLGGSAPAPQNTPTPESTVTPFLLPSPTATATITPIPYEMLIPQGWVQFKTSLVEIWLPKGFKKGDPKKIKDSADLATPELVITESPSRSSLYNMIVIVSYEPLTADSLDAYLDSEIAKIPTNIRMTERRKVSVNSVNAVRILLETRLNSVDANELTYVFLDGGTVWFVEYVAQISEFYEQLDTFERSVKTFRTVK